VLTSIGVSLDGAKSVKEARLKWKKLKLLVARHEMIIMIWILLRELAVSKGKAIHSACFQLSVGLLISDRENGSVLPENCVLSSRLEQCSSLIAAVYMYLSVDAISLFTSISPLCQGCIAVKGTR
jgi:hypothetical protein